MLGGLLLGALVLWIAATVLDMTGRPPLPRLFDAGAQHASQFAFSAEAGDQLEKAQQQLDAANRTYSTVRWLSDVATWASFLATAAITLITGSFSLPLPKPPEPRTQPGKGDTGKPPRPGRFYALGFLAAAASILTLLGSQLGTQAANELACAKQIRDDITQIVQALKDEPENESVLLVRLRDIAGRGCG